jgi:hypothetical protein
MLFKRAVTGILVIIVILAIVSATYVYAASNTLPAGRAGDGAAAIYKYNVTNITYGMDANNPQLISKVDFMLDADATTAKINLNNTATWYDCVITHTSPWPVTCSTSVRVLLTNNVLRVVALSQ